MNIDLDALIQMHAEWLKGIETALPLAGNLEKAKRFAADRFAPQVMDALPELVGRIRKQDAIIKKLLIVMVNNEDCPNYWDWSTGGYCHSFGAKCRYGECWEKAIQIEMEKEKIHAQ